MCVWIEFGWLAVDRAALTNRRCGRKLVLRCTGSTKNSCQTPHAGHDAVSASLPTWGSIPSEFRGLRFPDPPVHGGLREITIGICKFALRGSSLAWEWAQATSAAAVELARRNTFNFSFVYVLKGVRGAVVESGLCPSLEAHAKLSLFSDSGKSSLAVPPYSHPFEVINLSKNHKFILSKYLAGNG